MDYPEVTLELVEAIAIFIALDNGSKAAAENGQVDLALFMRDGADWLSRQIRTALDEGNAS